MESQLLLSSGGASPRLEKALLTNHVFLWHRYRLEMEDSHGDYEGCSILGVFLLF